MVFLEVTHELLPPLLSPPVIALQIAAKNQEPLIPKCSNLLQGMPAAGKKVV